jgi:vitamin B12 transporter
LVALRASGAQNDYTFTDDQGQRFDLTERQVRRQNADYAQLDAWLVHHHELGSGARMNTVLNAIDRDQGVTGLSVVPALHTRSSTRRWLLGNSIVLPCDPSETCRLELSSSWISATSRLTDPLVELSSLRTRQLDSAGDRVSHGARLELAPTHALRLSLAGALAIDNIRVDREGTFPRRGQRRSLVPKLGVSYRVLDALSVHALAAAECHWTRGVIVRLGLTAFQDSGPCGLLQPVGRVGAQYEVGHGLSLLSNAGRYVRMPTLSELYGTSPLVDGNPGLLPERGLTLDLGLRWSIAASGGALSALSIEAFGFRRDVDQIVRFRRTALESLTPFNVASARISGLEWAAAADLVGHLRLESAGTLLDPRETTPDARLDPTINDIMPYTSRLSVASAGELYADKPWPGIALERLGLRVSYLHRSSRFADVAGQNVLPAQHFLDAELAASLFGGRLLARFSTRNILDNQTSDLIGLPVPGRSYHASAEAWF